MSRWYDQACERLEKSLDNEEISDEEFREEMRGLNEELRQDALDDAEEAYKNTMGDW